MRSSISRSSVKMAVLVFNSQTGALISLNDAASRLLEETEYKQLQNPNLSSLEDHFTSGKLLLSSRVSTGNTSGSDLDYSINAKQDDGRVFSLSRYINPDNETILVAEDVTEAAQQARRARLNRLISERISNAPTLGAALGGLLRAICVCTGWSFGELWTTKGGKLARARVHLSRASALSATQGAQTCATIVAQAGLTGEMHRDNNFYDNEDADLLPAETGASIALPLIADGEVVAILHFAFARSKLCDQMSIDMLKGMAEQLAMVLKCRLHIHEEASAQKQLNEILMAAGDAIVSVDAQHRIQLFNRQAEILFGYTKEEVAGKHLHVLLPQSAHAAHAEHLKAFEHTSKGARFMGGRPEIKGRRKDGSEFPAEASVSRTIIGDEIVYTAVVRDLTALKEAQDALVLSEKRMRAIVESMPFGISISSAENGRIIFVNEAFCALAEAQLDEIVGRDLTTFLDLQADGQIVPGKRGRERQLRTASGALRWCMTASVALNVAGRETILYGYYDVTDRRSAIDALRISAHNLSEAERIAHLGNWQWDLAAGGLKFSDEAYRIAGIEPADADISYVRFLDCVHPEDREEVDRSLQLAIASRNDYEQGFRIVRPDGTFRHVQLQTEIKRDDAGRVLHMMGTIQDVTDLKRVQEELWIARELAETANRAKSQFLANMSHELRTPLNAIIGFSELMVLSSEHPMAPAQYQEYAQDINQSGRKLLNVVDDILDLSSIECGHAELDEYEFDITEVIDQRVERLSNRLTEASLTLTRKIVYPAPRLFADRKLFEQMIENLLSNAVKFTPAGGKIHIEADLTDDGSLCIEVQDSGIGISSEDMERIFLPFVQAEGHLARRYDGVGLGLALTKEYVRLHDGALRFRSEVGIGTRVLIQFPPTRVVAISQEMSLARGPKLVSSSGSR